MDGKGTLMYANSCEYSGDWKMGKVTGKGKFTNTNGDVFEGDLIDNKANGFGVY